nr:dihydrofolate reductase family protein [Lachnobacterium bovis]
MVAKSYEKPMPVKTPVSFVLLDNKHLTEHGVKYFCARSKEFVLITTNRNHPAFNVSEENLHIIYQDELSLEDALIQLRDKYGCERITIQSGGTVNGIFLREKLFDYVDIVVAPVLIGGKETSTLVDGIALTKENELDKLGVLRLLGCEVLENSYVRLRYKVVS